MINPAPGFWPIFGPLGPTAGPGSPGNGPGSKNNAVCSKNQPRRQSKNLIRGHFVFLGTDRKKHKTVNDQFEAPQDLHTSSGFREKGECNKMGLLIRWFSHRTRSKDLRLGASKRLQTVSKPAQKGGPLHNPHVFGRVWPKTCDG
jgi:hypothetical protein